jgi:dGTPase
VADWLDANRRKARDTAEDNRVQSQRTDFDRDYGRLLHCSSFRRLQGKTQLWGVLESDYFRTRLTHSLEAAQIGGAVAKEFGRIPPELVMTSCLAHDIGHPPFGHDGAKVLKDFAERVTSGKATFDDNAQTFRVVSRIEGAFGSSFGLNLTYATIDGTIKYKRVAQIATDKAGYYPEDEPAFTEVVQSTGTGKKRSPIVMFVELADDIAYACHDFEDALRAGFVTIEDVESRLDGADESQSIAICYILQQYRQQVSHHSDDPDCERVAAKRLKSRLVDRCISLALEHKTEIESAFDDLKYDDDLRRNLFFDKSAELKAYVDILKDVIARHVIDDPNVQRLRFASNELLRSYLGRYESLIQDSKLNLDSSARLSLPKGVRRNIDEAAGPAGRCRAILDYVAGMTDRYLMEQASVFFDLRHDHAVSVRR